MIKLASVFLTIVLLSGCGGEESSSASNATTNSSNIEDSLFDGAIDSVWDWFSSDEDEIDTSEKLGAALDTLARSTNSLDKFTSTGLDLVVVYIDQNYFFGLMPSFDLLEGENLAKNFILSGYMEDIYNEANEASSQVGLFGFFEDESTEPTIIDKIIQAIYEYIKSLIFSSEMEVEEPENSYVIQPKDSYEFVQEELNSKTYFVASQQYMNVTFSDDGSSGRGEIGFGLGADFTSYISGGKLFIDMDGVYEVTKVYEDPGYCIASTMLDSASGTLYDAYWFVNEEDYDKAEDIKLAESLCYIHSADYVAPVVIKDGILEPIEDEREGHSPVTKSSTSIMVDELLSGISNTANIKDAKYFARSMRHGIFSIYTTNNQTHTLQEKETAKIMREVLPLGASSALSLQELMGNAYDSSVAFQEEVNRDLNSSVSEVNARLDAIITATSQAMDRTVSPNYHGVSDPTAFGDIVDFNTINKDISLFKNSVKADVIIRIDNFTNNSIEADVEFETAVTTTVFGSGEIQFSDIDATSSSSYISGVEYKLFISDFNYHRATGIMTLNGNGYLGLDSRLTLNSYEVVANFQESPSLELLKFSVTANGDITTQSGRVFNGVLVFDGENTSNSKMDGVLTGINDEPVINGLFQTSLDLDDINGWLDDHSELSTSIDNIGEQSYFMEVLISKDDKSVSADMLVGRDESEDKWTYVIQELHASDANGVMEASKIYLTQKGSNTLAQSLEKIALSGMSLDTDIDALINLGWDVANDFDNIGIEGLAITMKPTSGDININSTLHVVNNNDTMSADLNATYDYAATHLSAVGDFETVVTTGQDENSYENSFVVDGMIKVDNQFNYKYALDYDDIEQYILFTRDDSSYQMGFVLRGDEIKGADSYGVLADFSMNETYDTLENMTLTNTDDDALGVYDRATDSLKVIFDDNSEEYMYLY